MEQSQEVIEKVRAAIKDRAIWFALLYKEFCEALPASKVEELARRAIRGYGRYKGRLDGKKLDEEELLDRFIRSGGAALFGAEVIFGEKAAENRVTVCPLVDAWREMGLSPDRVELFCDIAMEGDRGRAEYHGIQLDLASTLAKGDSYCTLLYCSCLREPRRKIDEGIIV